MASYGYGSIAGSDNAVLEARVLKSTERQPSLDDQLRALYAQIAQAHAALDELEQGPQPEKDGPMLEPHGIFETTQRACDGAMKLRDRVQTIAQRLGRL